VSQRRTLILVAAIAIGALASFLVWNYVQGVQDQAYQGAARVPVYLIKQQVPRGMSGAEAQAYIVKENIPRKFKPSNAIVSLDDISGKVALSNLVPNQVVVSDMFVAVSDPRAQQSFAERLSKIRGEDMTAITIQVDKIHGVAGLVQPGDYVNVMVNTELVSASTTGSSAANGSTASESSSHLRMLYQKVLVLAMDKDAVPQPGDTSAADGSSTSTPAASADSGVLTLIVPVRAAEWLGTAQNKNAIYLSLVAPDYTPKVVDDPTPNEVYPGADPKQITPYGPDGDKAAG
jgi:Flp pilus assembly protein CpaB